MANPMQNKTPEERRAIALKAHETRRKNKESQKELERRADAARQKIRLLEQKITGMECMEIASRACQSLCDKRLLRESEIVKASQQWRKVCGVYFLIDKNKVVYVGQSQDVYSRIAQHCDKQFDRYAFVVCPQKDLDAIESLYIHVLQPPLNGVAPNGVRLAPMDLTAIVKSVMSQIATLPTSDDI